MKRFLYALVALIATLSFSMGVRSAAWASVGIGSLLKTDDNWVRQTREKSTYFLSEQGNSLVNKLP